MNNQVIKPGQEAIEELKSLFTKTQLSIIARCINAEIEKDARFDDRFLEGKNLDEAEWLEYIFSMAEQESA